MSELGLLFGAAHGLAFQTLAGQLAYIDPATGSMVFQMLVAGFLGALVAFRNLRHRIASKLSGLFGRGRPRSADTPSEPGAPPSEPASDVPPHRP